MAMTCVFGVGVFKTSLTASAAEPNALRARTDGLPTVRIFYQEHYALSSFEFQFLQSYSDCGIQLSNNSEGGGYGGLLNMGFYTSSPSSSSPLHGWYVMAPLPPSDIVLPRYHYYQIYSRETGERSEWMDFLDGVATVGKYKTTYTTYKVVSQGTINSTPLVIQHEMNPNDTLYVSLSYYGDIIDSRIQIPDIGDEYSHSIYAYFYDAYRNEAHPNTLQYTITSTEIQITAENPYMLTGYSMVTPILIALAKP